MPSDRAGPSRRVDQGHLHGAQVVELSLGVLVRLDVVQPLEDLLGVRDRLIRLAQGDDAVEARARWFFSFQTRSAHFFGSMRSTTSRAAWRTKRSGSASSGQMASIGGSMPARISASQARRRTRASWSLRA